VELGSNKIMRIQCAIKRIRKEKLASDPIYEEMMKDELTIM
jgi:hypothetical protein